jgi:uncharacterized protein (DUF1810 family)
MPNLNRFHEAQKQNYEGAYAELVGGAKTGHWIWYIFPQLKGLGMSGNSITFGIEHLEEACDYLEDNTLFNNYLNISLVVLQHLKQNHKKVVQLMGSDIDAKKLASSATLFRETAEFLIQQGKNNHDYARLKACCEQILTIIQSQGYPVCQRTLQLLEPQLKQKTQTKEKPEVSEAKTNIQNKLEKPTEISNKKVKSNNPDASEKKTQSKPDTPEKKTKFETQSKPHAPEKKTTPETQSKPHAPEKKATPKTQNKPDALKNKKKPPDNKNSFFAKPKRKKPVYNYAPLSNALDTYIKKRTNEWDFHYNFLAVVTLTHKVLDAIKGTDRFHEKHRKTKMNAAIHLKQLIDDSNSGPMLFTALEKKALTKGRLGAIIAAHGGFDTIIKNIKNRPKPKNSKPTL